MNIVIAGGTGFVGKAMAESFAETGDQVFVLTRQPAPDRPGVTHIEWLTDDARPEKHLPHEHIDAFINLAGDPINTGRWTIRKKEMLISSRVQTTRESIRIVSRLDERPGVFINASAVGYYGHSTHMTFDESSPSLDNSFLSHVCKRWEREAREAERLGVRTVTARIGVVLGNEGGALPKMVLPYRIYMGGTIGTGKQWVPWIHIQDIVGLMRFVIENKVVTGAMNLTAPHPVRMAHLGKTIGNVLNRPHWFSIPERPIELLLGEMSGVLLKGQRVLPEKALEHNYKFHFEHIEDALANLLSDH